jgi:hypothetical protein
MLRFRFASALTGVVALLTTAAGAPPARPWRTLITADRQPDIQGVWVNRSITPLERPAALANRATLTDEEVRVLRQRVERLFTSSENDFVFGDNIFLAALLNLDRVKTPNSTGSALDMIDREVDNRTSLIVDPPDGRIPEMTNEGRVRLNAAQVSTQAIPFQLGADARAAAATPRPAPRGPEDLSNFLRCLTWGVPRVGGNARYDSHYQIVQSPASVVILSEVNGARLVPIDGRPHLPASVRQLNGDSRGRWDGATLVVDTTNFSPQSAFMGSAEHLHLVERFTRVSTDTLEYRMTIDDPTTWTRPWTAVVNLRKSAEQLYEFACHEGNRNTIEGILRTARAKERAD